MMLASGGRLLGQYWDLVQTWTILDMYVVQNSSPVLNRLQVRGSGVGLAEREMFSIKVKIVEC